jgi:hypothetical protein
MSSVFTVEAGSHPVASGVRVKLVSHEEVAATPQYGAGVKFVFESLDGPAPGTRVYRTVSGKVTPTNGAGKFFAQLFGVPTLTPAMQLDVGTLIGKAYVATIAQSPQGKGTRVEALVVAPF